MPRSNATDLTDATRSTSPSQRYGPPLAAAAVFAGIYGSLVTHANIEHGALPALVAGGMQAIGSGANAYVATYQLMKNTGRKYVSQSRRFMSTIVAPYLTIAGLTSITQIAATETQRVLQFEQISDPVAGMKRVLVAAPLVLGLVTYGIPGAMAGLKRIRSGTQTPGS